jgi:hypothetical protein
MLQGIGLIVVTLGIIGLIWGIFQKLKAGRVADAPLASTGDVARRGHEVAGPKGQISAQGNVICQQPLIAPFSGQPCLWFKLTCKAEWKEGETHKSKELEEIKQAAQFAIDDGSGPVWVDAREGGDFEPTTTKRETKGTGILGGITGTELVFGNYRVQTGMLSLGTKYTVEESVMPIVPRIYACGKLADQGGAIAPPTWRQLILSQKSRDELLASATKGAKIFLAAGAAAFLVGSGMAAVGQFVLTPSEEETKPVASAPASTTPPPPVVASAAPPPPVDTAPAASTGTTKTTSAVVKGGAAKDAGAPKPAAAKDAGAPKK